VTAAAASGRGPGGREPDRPADEAPAPPVRVERVVADLADGGAAALPWTEPYRRAALGRASSYYEFHESVNRSRQTDMLIDLLAVEAPVSIDYAIRRLAEAWGIQRAGHRVVHAARQAIGQAGRRDAAVVRGEFLWRPNQTLAVVRIPNSGDPETRRDIDDIPPEELDLAIQRVREASAGLEDEQLVAQVARIFGFERTGERIRAALLQRLATPA
jgi:hypothetical protein